MRINNKTIDLDGFEDKFECALYLQENWEFEKAEAEYQNFLVKNFDNSSALYNLGVLYAVHLQQPEKSLHFFESALNIDPTNLQFWFSYLDALIKVGALEMAEQVLLLAKNYGLNDLQVAYFRKDIRLARATINDWIDPILADVPALPLASVPRQENHRKFPDPTPGELQPILSLFNQKKYEKARQGCAKMVKKYPKSSMLPILLIEVEKALGNTNKVLELREALLKQEPENIDFLEKLALAYLAVQNKEKAQPLLEKIIALDPGHALAHAELGKLYEHQEKIEAAKISYARSLENNPHSPLCLQRMGDLLERLGDEDGSLTFYKAAVLASPQVEDLYRVYGETLHRKDRLAAAEDAFRKALTINPGGVKTIKSLCYLLEQHGRFKEAQAGLMKCAKISNESADTLYEIGRNLVLQKKEKEALDWLRRAIQAEPNLVQAHITLSAALNTTDDPEAAAEEIQKSIALHPKIPHLYTNLGVVYLSLSRVDDAIFYLQKALEVSPKFSHARSSLLFALSHSTKIAPEQLYREHREYGKLIEEEVKGKVHTQYTNVRDPQRPLRVGFVSADLRNHAVAQFVMPFFEELKKYPDIITYAYANHGAVDDAMLRIQKNIGTWRTVVKWTDDKLAEQIREDQIDILVDMSGHTAGDRLKVFARHPAPIQMTWLGYPGTTGLQTMDYCLIDQHLLPGVNINHQFTEKLIRLPRAFSFEGKDGLKDIPFDSRSPCIQNKFITFGSFNRLNKVNQEVIALWSEVLHAVPDSRLLMGAMPSSGVPDLLLQWFADQGISQDRLIFYPRSSFASYMELHNQVDLCLDTFPYTGGTTTNHALWMGVPTVTWGGPTYPHYQGALFLHQVGLDKYCVAKDKDDFVIKAVQIAQNAQFLNHVRQELRGYLQNNEANALHTVVLGFVSAFRTTWKNWCTGKSPKNIEITAQDLGVIDPHPDWDKYFQ